jgi:deoxyribonuclease-4
MKLGRHMTGGSSVGTSIGECIKFGGSALQVFPGGTLSLKCSKLEFDDVYRDSVTKHELHGVVHAAFSCNPISSDETVKWDQTLRDASIDYLIACVEWANNLGFKQVVFHPGSCQDPSEFSVRLRDAIRTVVLRTVGLDVQILAEHMACGMGASYSDIKAGVYHVGHRAGICYDTTHAWAAGHDIDTICYNIKAPEVKLVHLNPPKKGFCKLGSGKDRHGSVGFTEWDEEQARRVIDQCIAYDKPMVTEAKRTHEAFERFRDYIMLGNNVLIPNGAS